VSVAEAVQATCKASSSSSPGFVLQRKCACGGSAGFTGDCEECRRTKLLGKALKRKLAVNEPDDEHEREADRVAERVMRVTEPATSSSNATPAAASPVEGRVGGAGHVAAAPALVREALASPGQPPDASARAFLEPRLGRSLDDVRLLSPVLHPPSVRLFEDHTTFAFANPAAVKGPGGVVHGPRTTLTVLPRVAALIGAEGAIGGFTVLAEWRAEGVAPPKDRDFALGLGPVVVTPDTCSLPADGFDWAAAVQLAALGTALFPGDILAGPPVERVVGEFGDVVEVEIDGLGALEQRLA